MILLGCFALVLLVMLLVWALNELFDLDGRQAERRRLDQYHQIMRDCREQGLPIREAAKVLAAYREIER